MAILIPGEEPICRPQQNGGEWVNNQSEVLRLAKFLHDHCEFCDISQVLYFFSKPWKWQVEYRAMTLCDENKLTVEQVEEFFATDRSEEALKRLEAPCPA